MAYQAIAKNGEIYHISPQYWQQNQQQQALLLRYFALPLKAVSYTHLRAHET